MKIIIPTDFSKCARNAANFAVQYALNQQAEVLLMHTFVLRYTDNSYFIDLDLSLQDIAKKQLQMEKERLLEAYPELEKLNVTTACEIGGLVENLEHFTEKENYDLIIMGTKGVSGWEEVFIGSEAAAVIAQVAVPVLVIPPKLSFNVFANLAYASSLQDALVPLEVSLIQSFSQQKSRLTLFHSYADVLDINEKSELETKVKFQGYFNDFIIDVETDYDKSKIEGIELYLDQLKPDLVIAKTEQKNFLQRIFSVSVTETLTHHANYPLLVLKK